MIDSSYRRPDRGYPPLPLRRWPSACRPPRSPSSTSTASAATATPARPLGPQLQTPGHCASTPARQPLDTQLQPERQALQTAVNALAGKQPDAALHAARPGVPAEAKRRPRQELERQQTQIQRNQAYISSRSTPSWLRCYQPVMDRRGANVLIDTRCYARASPPRLDVTNDVLAALNAALPSVATTAPAQRSSRPRPAGPVNEARRQAPPSARWISGG